MTRKLFNALPHIDIHVVLGRPGSGHRAAQQQWEQAGVRRRVVLTVPHFVTAALAASETDSVAALPDRLAALCVRLLPLKKVAAAFPLPRLTTVMVWHERTDADPGAAYLRQLVAEAVRSPAPALSAPRRARGSSRRSS